MRSTSSAGSSAKFASFIDALLFHAVRAPNNPAIGLESGVITYGQMADAIFAATARCEKAGLRPGSVVGLMISEPVWHICLIAALYRLGVPSVSIGASTLTLQSLRLAAVLHDAALPGGFSGNAMPVEADWFTHRASSSRLPDASFGETDLCRIALSSGTTGEPKPIALSPQIIWDRLTTYSFRGSFSCSERIYCGPQLQSQFGFAIAFSALAYGKMVCFSDSAETSIPVMSYYKADLAIISVFQLNRLIEVQEKNLGGLSALREIQAGGALISESLLQRTRKYLTSAIVSAYASTEAGTAAFANVEQLGNAHAEGAIGFVTPWTSVDICDDEHRVLPPGRDGNVRIRSLGLAPMYEPGMTRVETPEPFFPGDYGRLLSNGILVIAGRTTEVVNIGGNKMSPDRFENIILQCRGVKDAAVFTVDVNSTLPQVWAAVVADSTVDVGEIVKRCGETPMIGTPTVIKIVPSIPRNSAGKILREQLRKDLTKSSA